MRPSASTPKDKKVYVPETLVAKAKNVDLLALIQKCGYEVKRTAMLKNGTAEYCLREHDSFKISNNCWCWHSRGGFGGSTIDFIMNVAEKGRHDFQSATLRVLEILYGKGLAPERQTEQPPQAQNETGPPKPFVLPLKYKDYSRVFAYLTKTRGIDNQIVADMVRAGKLYESVRGNNCVFIGFDTAGIPRYATERGTLTHKDKRYVHDVEGSRKEFGFVMEGHSSRLYIFESPVDVLSHATITKMNGGDYKSDTRLSLGCVSDKALFQYLNDHPGKITGIVLCLDNDKGGREAANRIAEKIPVQYSVSVEFPSRKDYNDELIYIKSLSKGRVI